MLDGVAGPALRPGLDHDRVACRVGHVRDLAGATVVQRLLFGDFQVQLPDDYLTKVDVASMAAFAMPLPQWFQREFGVVLERLLFDGVAEREGWINSTRVLRELQEHRNRERDNHTRLWLI